MSAPLWPQNPKALREQLPLSVQAVFYIDRLTSPGLAPDPRWGEAFARKVHTRLLYTHGLDAAALPLLSLDLMALGNNTPPFRDASH